MQGKTQSILLSLLAVLLTITLFDACSHEPFLDPGTLNNGEPSIAGCDNGGQICFESSILPIFVSSCARSGCHDAISHRGEFILDSYQKIIRKGIVAGNASESKIYKVLIGSGDDRMPPDGSLTTAQIDSIKLWINQGAQNTVNCNCFCDPEQYAYATDIAPIINNSCVGCHNTNNLSGGINLQGYSNLKIVADNGKLVGSITHAAGYVPMPQGGKLTECEITKIQNWVAAGAPND